MGHAARANKNSAQNTTHERVIKTTIREARDLARIGRPETLAAILASLRRQQREKKDSPSG